MAKQKPKSLDVLFAEQLVEIFVPAVAALGLDGGLDPPGRVPIASATFHGDGVQYRISADPSEHVVSTSVLLTSVEPRVRALLADIVVAAELGPAQAVYSNSRLLEKSLASHAEWINRVHPLLAGDTGPGLVDSARRRNRTVRQPGRGPGR
jgi:hypothetical protein